MWLHRLVPGSHWLQNVAYIMSHVAELYGSCCSGAQDNCFQRTTAHQQGLPPVLPVCCCDLLVELLDALPQDGILSHELL